MTANLLLQPFNFFKQQLKKLYVQGSLIEKCYFSIYVLVSFSMLLYSFTQVDLGLVITRVPSLYAIEKNFQYIGYFNRPLSTFIFIFLILVLFFLYTSLLQFISQRRVKAYTVWSIILFITVILAFSYNAFSYDLFNYIFDAKIITHYHQNPYLHKALDYPQDPMLGFMHWTHRSYPYGPIWLILTTILSFLGFQVFLLTFLLFKFFTALCFLGSVFYIGKIFQKINPQKELFGLVFFGLNPLILVECLVSAHIDTIMVFFALTSVYFLIHRRYISSYSLLFASIGIKFLTGVLLPLFVLIHVLFAGKKEVKWQMFFAGGLVLLIVGVLVEIQQSGNFQPWYLVLPLSFAVFLSQKYFIFIPSVIISFMTLFLYAPYLSTGNWNPPVPQILSGILLVSYIFSFLGIVYYFLYKKYKKI